MRKKNEVSEIYNKNIFCGRSKPDLLFNMPNAHYHNHHEIYYLISGKRKYFIENQIYNVNKGDIVLIPKGVLHKTIIADNSYHQRLLISFNDSMLYPDYNDQIQKCFNQYYYHMPNALSGQAEMLLLKIENEYKKNDVFGENIIKGILLEFFAFLIRNSDKFSSEQSKTKSDNRIQQIATYLSENYDKDINLIDIARLYAISPEHLSRKFKKVTGFGFSEYLTLVRVKQAEKLLSSAKIPVTEVASLCGFNDSNYFSAVFKKTTGISPVKYKKLNS